MALHIKRTSLFKTRIMSTMLMIFALMVQPLVVLNIPAAFAATQVTSGEFTTPSANYHNGENYKGIVVDIRYANVSGLKDLSVTVNRSSGDAVTKVAKEKTINDINSKNGANGSTTAPIIVQHGTYDEADSSSWYVPANTTWTKDTVPLSVVITMTFADGSSKSTAELPVGGSVTYAQIAPGPVHNTNSNKYFDTIQAAVNDASNGDRITVASGTYTENVQIKKRLTLTGIGASKPVVTSSTGSYTVELKGNAASGTTIEGFDLRKTGNGTVLKLEASANLKGVIIKDNFFSNQGTGLSSSHLIYGGNLTNVQITENTLNVTSGLKAFNADGVNTGLSITGNGFNQNSDVALLTVNSASDSVFSDNYLTLTSTTNDKIIELKGTNNTATGNTYGNNMVAIEDADGSFQGVYGTVSGALGASGDKYRLSMSTGTYNENIDINKSMTLGGVSGTVVNGQVKVDFGANDVTLEGFTLRNDGKTAVKVPSAVSLNSLTLRGMDVDSYKAIYIGDGTGTLGTFTLVDSKVSSNYPIYIDHPTNNVEITGSEFTIVGGNRGVVLANQPTTNTVNISNNTFVMGSDADSVTMNFVKYEPANHSLLETIKGSNDFSGSTTTISGDNKAIVVAVADTVKPVMEDYKLSNYNLRIGGDNPTLTGTTTDDTGVTSIKYAIFKYVNGERTSVRSWKELPAADSTSYGDTTVKTNSVMNLKNLPEGVYEFSVRAWDAAGNKTNGGDMAFRVDNTAPAVTDLKLNGNTPKVMPSDNGEEPKAEIVDHVNGTLNISANISDGAAGSGIKKVFNAKLMKLKANGSTDSAAYQQDFKLSTTDGITWTGSVDTKNPANKAADGLYQLFFNVEDEAGNRSSARINVYIDNTAPSAPAITAPGARTWHKAAPITNSWSAASDVGGVAYYQVAYNYGDGHDFGGSTCPDVAIAGVSGFIGCRDVNGFSRDHQPNENEQGGVTIWVRAVDKAGNIGPWSKSVHYYYDQTAPVGDISFPTNGSIVQTEGGKLKVNGKVIENLSMNRVGVQLVKPGVSGHIQYLYHHMVNQNPGTWNVEFDAAALNLANGLYGLNLYFTDMAGNTSVEQIQFTIDNPTPVVNGENFNTHSGSDYNGLNVGFNIADFNEVTGVTVELYDGETLMVANTHNQNLLDLIAGGETQLSTPFITSPGTYTEEYWELGEYDWTSDSPRPTKAVVTVVGTNNLGQAVTKTAILENFTEPNGWTFASILPEEEPEAPQNRPAGGAPRNPGLQTFANIINSAGEGNQIFQRGNFATGLPTGNEPGEQEEGGTEGNDPTILGEQDESDSLLDDTAILGAQDEGGVLGLSWQWWLAIVAGLIGGWLLLAAAIRRMRGAES